MQQNGIQSCGGCGRSGFDDMTQALQRFLFKPDMRLWKYCVIAFPVAAIPTLFMLASLFFGLDALGIDVDLFIRPRRLVTTGEVLGAVVFAPIVETFLLAGRLAVLSTLSSRAGFVALSAAMIWGALHAAIAVMWFFGVVWSFFVFSCAYQCWRKKSFGAAFLAASVPHALINSVAMIFAASV